MPRDSKQSELERARKISPRVTWVYLLFLAGAVAALVWQALAAVLVLVAIMLAYSARPLASPAEASHYFFQIRTFWIWLVGALVAVAMGLIVLSWLGFIALSFWLFVRTVQGLRIAREHRAHPRPAVWFWL